MEDNSISLKIPKHIGIIMDGNGRWATARGKKREFGHKQGCKNVDRIVTHAFKIGIKAVTLFAFSAENWSRPQHEVDALMNLIKVYFEKYINKIVKNGVRLSVMGDLTRLPKDTVDIINLDVEKSKIYKDKVLNIAINYGGRQEIVMAVNKLISGGEEITVEGISQNLYTASFGEPDLIIRTGGEERISNFMLFQSAYSELYFTSVLWPDFDENELDKAVKEFSLRDRRYGNVKC